MPASTTAAKPQKAYIVRRSSIHGRGVFAAMEIPRGMRIVEYKGKRTSWDDALARPDSDPDDPAHTFLFEIDDGRVIDARVRGNAARWINHSCAPNCVTHEYGAGRVFIEAKRRIRQRRGTYVRLPADDRWAAHAQGARAVRMPLRREEVPRHAARRQERSLTRPAVPPAVTRRRTGRRPPAPRAPC